MKFCSNHSRFYRVSIVLMHLAHSSANLFDNWLQIPFGRKILRLFQNNREKPLYICWFVMCRLSRKVQDSYCSVQNIQDKRAFLQGRANVLNILYTAEESCTEQYGNMTNQQIYFSGLTSFVHTCLGLICEI